MEITEILKQPFDKALAELTKDPQEKDAKIDDYRKAFTGQHAILDDTTRRDVQITNSDGTNRTVKHTKETIPYQKRIVNSAVTFLFGEPLKLILNDEEADNSKAFDRINEVWKQNKLDYFNKALARDLFVECKVAELWHVPKKEEGKDARIRVVLLSTRAGYKIYPHYDDEGDMDAFTLRFDTKDDKGKTIANATIFTATNITDAFKKEGGEWKDTKRENLAGKIPIVYYEQDEPEWKCVETQINRAEYLVSNFADTVDYNGSPILQIKGTVNNLPQKEETGKVVTVALEYDDNGKASCPGGVEYVTWDQAPEAIRLEYDILKDTIYGMTSTPDLSFQNVKGMQAVSGIALRLMFSDALFKALDKQETFGPAMERRLSIMKAMIGVTDNSLKAQLDNLDIDIKFGDVLPQNIQELIESLTLARGGEPIMSEESAVKHNPLVTDADEDIKALKGEKAALKSFGESYE